MSDVLVDIQGVSKHPVAPTHQSIRAHLQPFAFAFRKVNFFAASQRAVQTGQWEHPLQPAGLPDPSGIGRIQYRIHPFRKKESGFGAGTVDQQVAVRHFNPTQVIEVVVLSEPLTPHGGIRAGDQRKGIGPDLFGNLFSALGELGSAEIGLVVHSHNVRLFEIFQRCIEVEDLTRVSFPRDGLAVGKQVERLALIRLDRDGGDAPRFPGRVAEESAARL